MRNLRTTGPQDKRILQATDMFGEWIALVTQSANGDHLMIGNIALDAERARELSIALQCWVDHGALPHSIDESGNCKI